MKGIAIVQPEVPHYREDFFKGLRRRCGRADVYVYNSLGEAEKNGFKVQREGVSEIRNVQWHGVVLYNPFTLLRRDYDTLVLMWHFAHLTTWLLLLTRFIHRKKIILYGQGISVKRYLKEERKPDRKLKWMLAMANGAWVYMPKEERQWKKIFPRKPVVALNNTVSGMEDILSYRSAVGKEELKAKYGITEKRVLIFCARFTSPYRRVDLLIETIDRLKGEDIGFIIIGDGVNKPDFSPYRHVYDKGAVYDVAVKRELFAIADIYFQPGWVGLSIVEAMGYGKPVFTFKRTPDTLQCVEYSYIVDGENGRLFEDIDECVQAIGMQGDEEIAEMGRKARLLASRLLPQGMVEHALCLIKNFGN